MFVLMFACGPSQPPWDSSTGFLAEDSTTEVIDPVNPPDAEVETIPPGDAREEDTPDIPLLVDPPRGIYSQPVTVTLASPFPEGEIFYTIDGRDPLQGFGIPYTGPLLLTTTTVLRMGVRLAGQDALPAQTHSYFFPADVPRQQQPADWPQQWWVNDEDGPFPADYAMDPEVTGTAAWAAATSVFEGYPIVSVVIPPEDLFDLDNGIHENAEKHGIDWERAASIEWLDSDQSWGSPCGLRIQGGSSRQGAKSTKKSFRAHFRRDYGANRLDQEVFEEGGAGQYQVLVLKGGYNRTWAESSEFGRLRATYAREAFGNKLYDQMGYVAPEVRPVQLLLDGLYWGLFQVEERPTDAFMADHYGGDREDWDVLNAGTLVDGEIVAWEELLEKMEGDLSGDLAYADLANDLDLEMFADYILLQLLLENVDWPDRNWYVARNREASGKWFFIPWDNELIMSDGDRSLVDWTYPDTPGSFFQALRNNEEFRVLFGDRVQRHMLNGVLSTAALQQTWTWATDRVEPGLLGESARWGDHWRDDRLDPDAILYGMTEWQAEVTRIKDRFFEDRADFVLQDFIAHDLYPAVAAPAATPAGGELAAGSPIVVSGPGTLYYTTDGSDPRLPGGAISASARVATGSLPSPGDFTLKARSWLAGDWSALLEATYQQP